MKTLTIKLKQHTPLIHFQHDQEGASLRASEVKPKLDRFILIKLGRNKYEETSEEEYIQIANKYDSNPAHKIPFDDLYDINISIQYYEIGKYWANKAKWLIGKGDHPALDYKMRIEAKNVQFWDIKSNERNQFPLFFANMNADFSNPNEYKRFSFTNNPIIQTITTRNESLYNYLFSNPSTLNEFFFITNFGTRQTKGFGSFSIDSSDSLFKKITSRYRFEVELKNFKSVNDKLKYLFERIELFYKTLRGGINQIKIDKRTGIKETVFYFKSLSYLYAENVLKAKWEKRKIKEEFYNEDKDKWPIKQMPHTYDIKDMFGFSTNEKWLAQKDNIEKKALDKDVERMPSPILFKPIYNEEEESYCVYIILQDDKVHLSEFKNQKIKIKSQRRNRDFIIDLPQEFSTKSFFEYIFIKNEAFDISTHVEERYQNHHYYELLKEIFSQIRNNIKK